MIISIDAQRGYSAWLQRGATMRGYGTPRLQYTPEPAREAPQCRGIEEIAAWDPARDTWDSCVVPWASVQLVGNMGGIVSMGEECAKTNLL